MRTGFWANLFDLIAPRTCTICGRRLAASEQTICVVCHLHLPLTHLEAKPYDNVMARLFWGILPVERAAAMFYYEPHSEVARIIYDLKYHGQADIGIDMGQMAARQFARSNFFEGIDAIVPVPLTRMRRWQRGYNQSERIARGVSLETGLPVYTDVVKRQRFDKSQTKNSAWERLDNVEGAFVLTDGSRISGKHLLVVDDVVTTGATIKACALQLCQAGDVKISILSLGLTKTI